MNYFPLSKDQEDWRDRIAELAAEEIGPLAAAVDASGNYPKESINALGREGFWGLRTPKEYGGLGLDLLTTCLIVEEIAKKCPSTAMCYKMHLEAVEVINLIPTDYQVEAFLKPLGEGKIFASAPGGESGGQAGDDWRPNTAGPSTFKCVDGNIVIDNVRKSYVTSAGQCTHYTMFCYLDGYYVEGPANLIVVESDKIDWEVVGEWNGLGMRGNGSAPMRFNGRVPEKNILGADISTKALWDKYFSPLQILTYGAAYIGVASGAFELACTEGGKRHPSGYRRIDSPMNFRRMSEMSAQIESARAMLHSVASVADRDPDMSPLPYLQAKVVCSETAVKVTQEIMTMFGGTAFAGRLPFERYFRDARAGLIMGVANDQAYQRIGGFLFPDD